jgi:hypothetical protein
MSNGSVIKVWRYTLPPIKGEGWGVFLLDSTGMFSAFTDFGNYVYKWTHHESDDFREEVVSMAKSHDYVLSKISHKDRIDNEATYNLIKAHLLSSRREDYLTRDEARKEWQLLHEAYEEGSFVVSDWYEKTIFDDAHEYLIRTYPPNAKMFVEKLLPRLAEEIEKELKADGSV